MRHFLAITFFIFSNLMLQAQLVTTVAGQPEISGNNDGAAFDATFNNPHGIAVGIDGIVYTTDRWSHTIRKIELDGTVSTFAGTAGVSGDADGVGTAATFFEPWGICVDHEGTVFVADTRNNKIRKITPAGVVTTLAGSGNYGSSNGTGSSTTFGNPTGIEVDNLGNVYVADHLTHIIRKINNLGVVSTLAGKPYQTGSSDGLGNQASFNRPYGLSLDLDGNILVADEWNHTIRRVTPLGMVTTVAGDGTADSDDGLVSTASFNFPWDITVDSLGNIYVADGYNYTIRKILPIGEVTSYAGNTGITGASDGVGVAATFSGATALAFSPVTQELYVGDAYNHLVRKITDLNQGVALSLSSGNATICPEEYIEVIAYPDIFDTYHFYVDNLPVQSGANPIFETNDLAVGVHSLQVLAIDGSNSVTSTPMTIETIEPIIPTVSTVGPTTFFEGDSVVMIASFGADYFWSNGETTATITVKEAGTYTVEVRDINGCVGISDTIVVEVQSNPDAAIISVQGETIICENENTTLISSSAENNQWLKDGWIITGATATEYRVVESGIYQVQVTHTGGVVVISEPVEITVLPAFEVDFTASATTGTVDDTFDFEITPTTIVSAEWDFGDNNTSTIISPSHQYAQEDTFSVSLIAVSAEGCQDTIRRENYILVNETGTGTGSGSGNGNGFDEADLFIPTAFTPNGDGENDILFVRGGSVTEMTFLVFNQWGEEIFKSVNQATGWDGTTQNTKVQIGNYAYILDYVDDQGIRRKIGGNVTVLR